MVVTRLPPALPGRSALLSGCCGGDSSLLTLRSELFGGGGLTSLGVSPPRDEESPSYSTASRSEPREKRMCRRWTAYTCSPRLVLAFVRFGGFRGLFRLAIVLSFVPDLIHLVQGTPGDAATLDELLVSSDMRAE